MKQHSLRTVTITLLFSVFGCGIYTFSGSTLPASVRTVSIPLFENRSLEPGLAEDLTQQLSQQVLASNLLRVVSEGGDAILTGAITNYSHEEYYYTITGSRSADVETYRVGITAEITFTQRGNDKAIYTGTVVGEGLYDFESETEEEGRRRAITDLVERILQNSVQGW